MSSMQAPPVLVAVSEVFVSIQGEGVSAGLLSVFVRLQGCSVGCVWCDSKYTWPERDATMSLTALIQQVKESGVTNVVITGGEPLENAAFVPLVAQLKSKGLRVEVETAGTIVPPTSLVDQWNVSLKLAHSRVPLAVRLPREAITEFKRLGAWFKFVVESEVDINEIVSIQKSFNLSNDHVLLMPLGMTAGEQTQRMEMVVSCCKQNGYRFSPRLQILIWGPKRGV